MSGQAGPETEALSVPWSPTSLSVHATWTKYCKAPPVWGHGVSEVTLAGAAQLQRVSACADLEVPEARVVGAGPRRRARGRMERARGRGVTQLLRDQVRKRVQLTRVPGGAVTTNEVKRPETAGLKWWRPVPEGYVRPGPGRTELEAEHV